MWLLNLLKEFWLFVDDVIVLLMQKNYPKPMEPLPAPVTNLNPEPVELAPIPVSKYAWDTRDTIWHSMRVIGDEYMMTWLQKDLLCDICQCESEFNIHAKLVNNPHSVDRGLFQWNNFYHPEITDEIAYDPEQTTRLACKAILAGKAQTYWSASEHCWNAGGKYNSIL